MGQTHRGVIVMSTFPDERSITQVAYSAVAGKLCACVNFAEIRSIYSWKDRLEDQKEYLALFKTTKKSAAKLKAEIVRLHPYEVPEIVQLNMNDVSRSYLSWLIASSSANRISKKRYNAAKR